MKTEQGVLRLSIAVTLLLALFGIIFGLAIGSGSIIFDGVYSILDVCMTLLALMVSGLITSSLAEGARAKLVQHFTMGFWHLEPIVLGMNGVLLMATAGYALLNAIGILMSGGREVEFGTAIIYGVVTMLTAITMALYGLRANRKIKSSFLALDAKAWMISAGMTGALLAAFIFGWLIQGTRHEWMAPYVDPAILAVVCVIVLPMPFSTVRQALADILLVTPADLKAHVDTVAAAVAKRHDFLGFRAYVARVGRGRQIELYFLVPPGLPPRPLEEWDRIRDQFGEALGGEGPDRWLTIAFTTDIEWAE